MASVISETTHTADILQGKLLNPVFYKLRSIQKLGKIRHIVFSTNPIFM